MPSSSSERRRRLSVRGEMPSSERSSSPKRARPSARSRITRSVHLPQTMSAVRQTGQSEFGTKAKDNARLHELKLLQRDLHVPLLGAADQPDGERLARCVEGVEQVVHAAE